MIQTLKGHLLRRAEFITMFLHKCTNLEIKIIFASHHGDSNIVTVALKVDYHFI